MYYHNRQTRKVSSQRRFLNITKKRHPVFLYFFFLFLCKKPHFIFFFLAILMLQPVYVFFKVIFKLEPYFFIMYLFYWTTRLVLGLCPFSRPDF